MKEEALLLQKTDGKASTAEMERYQGMTGPLMFSIVETRPDIAFAMSVASRFSKNPSHQHVKVVKTIFRLLKDTRDNVTTYEGEEELLIKG